MWWKGRWGVIQTLLKRALIFTCQENFKLESQWPFKLEFEEEEFLKISLDYHKLDFLERNKENFLVAGFILSFLIYILYVILQKIPINSPNREFSCHHVSNMKYFDRNEWNKWINKLQHKERMNRLR